MICRRLIVSIFLEGIAQFRSDQESKESESSMPKHGVHSRYIPALTRPGSTSTYHNIIISIHSERKALIPRHGGSLVDPAHRRNVSMTGITQPAPQENLKTLRFYQRIMGTILARTLSRWLRVRQSQET